MDWVLTRYIHQGSSIIHLHKVEAQISPQKKKNFLLIIKRKVFTVLDNEVLIFCAIAEI